MSKSKIPTLPANAARSAVIAFRDQVRTYARREFEQGATPEEVYKRVEPNGRLWALRASVEAEYLDFLGVSRKNARIAAVIVAMAVFFFLSGFAPPNNIARHYVEPVLIALVAAQAVERLVTAQLRSRLEKRRHRDLTGLGA